MKPNINIIESCKLKIASFTCAALKEVPAAVIDLNAYAGEYVHIWVDADGTYSIDPGREHYWHVAELQVSPRQYRIETEEVTQNGETQIRENPVPLPVDLSITRIITWDLPE